MSKSKPPSFIKSFILFNFDVIKVLLCVSRHYYSPNWMTIKQRRIRVKD